VRTGSLTATGLLLAGMVLSCACGGGSERGGEAPRPAPTPEPARPAVPVAPDAGGLAAGPRGSAVIRGTVKYEGAVPDLKPLSMSADPGCAAKHKEPVLPEALVLGSGGTMANVLVRVKSGLPQRQWPSPTAPVVMDQQGCRYRPHVMGVMVGQAFRVMNSDGLLHNVHALPKKNEQFNMAMPGGVKESEHRFAQAEDPFTIKCDVHPWMQCFVAVLDHPFFAVTAADGTYAIQDLPAGTYEVEAWHERLGTKSFQVTVADGGSGTADFKFSR
jgi:plastocyanin